MHLVGFTIEIYYDAWPCEHQKLEMLLCIVLVVENRKWTYVVCVGCFPSG